MHLRNFRFASPFAFGLLAALFLCAGPAIAVDFIRGFDVYSGDGAVNWTTAKNSGIQFAFVKATEGVNFVDSRFTTNMQNANAAGVYVGPYHVCRVDSKNGVPFTSYDGLPFLVNSNPWLDATSEAADFIDAIRPYYLSGSYLPPVADIETSSIQSLNFSDSLRKTFVSNWLQLFSDTVAGAIGVRPIVYSSKSSANTYYSSAIASSHKLWIAWWKGTGTTSPPLPSDTPSWTTPWTFWQYTNQESVPGVPGSEGPNNDLEDGDVFYGTAQQLTPLLVHIIPGDYNHDGVVNAADYAVYRDTRGQTGVGLPADGNFNNQIDPGDYTVWRTHFGQSAGSGASLGTNTAVAEPETFLYLGLAAAGWSLSRRQRFHSRKTGLLSGRTCHP